MGGGYSLPRLEGRALEHGFVHWIQARLASAAGRPQPPLRGDIRMLKDGWFGKREDPQSGAVETAILQYTADASAQIADALLDRGVTVQYADQSIVAPGDSKASVSIDLRLLVGEACAFVEAKWSHEPEGLAQQLGAARAAALGMLRTVAADVAGGRAWRCDANIGGSILRKPRSASTRGKRRKGNQPGRA